MDALRDRFYRLLRWSERYTKTDMVYLIVNGSWLNLNFAFTSLFSFFVSVAFANLLSKNEYGIYQYVLTGAALLSALTFTGMNSAITQAVARGYEGVVRSSIRIQFFWNLIAAGIAASISLYYFFEGNTVLGVGFLFVSVSLPLLNTYNTYSAFLSGRKLFREVALYSIFGNALYYICIFAAIFFFRSASILLFVNLSVTTITAIFFYIVTIRKFAPNEVPDPEVLPYAKHLTIMNVLSVIASNIDKFLVFQFLGAASLASYALAVLLPDKLAGGFKGLLLPAIPRFVEGNMENIRNTMRRKVLQVLVMALGCAVGYAIVAQFVLPLIYPTYTEIIPYSQVYALTFVAAAGYLISNALLAHKKVQELYTLNIGVPIVQIVIQIIGMLFMGLWGLIIAKILSAFFFTAFAFLILNGRSATI